MVMCAPTSIVASANNIASTGLIQTLVMYNQVIGAVIISSALAIWFGRASGILKAGRLRKALRMSLSKVFR